MKHLKYMLVMLFFQLAVSFYSQAQVAVVDTVCISTQGEVYHVKPTDGSLYLWWIEGGTIVSPQGRDSVVVNWSNSPGTYMLKVLEVNTFGCPGDTVKGLVVVNGPIDVHIEGPIDVCRGETVMLEAKGGRSYIWSTGQQGASIFVNPDRDTGFYVIGLGGGCKDDTAYWNVRVHDKPRADFVFEPKDPKLDENIDFQYNGKGATEYLWVFNDSQVIRSSGPNPSFSFHNPGLKKVSLVVRNASGCTDTISYTFNLKKESYIFVPSAFSPDGDGLNDELRAVGMGINIFEMAIFNRWGERIFESDRMDKGWDGSYKGKMVQEGVYIYSIRAQGIDGQWYYLKGNITVLR